MYNLDNIAHIFGQNNNDYSKARSIREAAPTEATQSRSEVHSPRKRNSGISDMSTIQYGDICSPKSNILNESHTHQEADFRLTEKKVLGFTTKNPSSEYVKEGPASGLSSSHAQSSGQASKMDSSPTTICADYLRLKSDSHEGKLVGFYTQKERRNKINHMRQKLLRHKTDKPISKHYKGRSKAARCKARFCGKFVSAELAEKYSVDDEQFYKRNALIDKYVKSMDFQKTVDVLTEY